MPKTSTPITTLFLDIGGVLLTNGWGRGVRKQAAELFGLDYADMDERHHLTFNTFEDGKLTLDQYLDQLVFYQERTFTREKFKEYMYAQSKAFPDMINLICELKARYRLKITVVSNEGRELTTYRVQKFNMTSFVDTFIVSSFVHFRKPDADIYRLALDVTQVTPDQVVYIDDRPLFIQVAKTLGIESIQHNTYEDTVAALAEYGLTLAKPNGG